MHFLVSDLLIMIINFIYHLLYINMSNKTFSEDGWKEKEHIENDSEICFPKIMSGEIKGDRKFETKMNENNNKRKVVIWQKLKE